MGGRKAAQPWKAQLPRRVSRISFRPTAVLWGCHNNPFYKDTVALDEGLHDLMTSAFLDHLQRLFLNNSTQGQDFNLLGHTVQPVTPVPRYFCSPQPPERPAGKVLSVGVFAKCNGISHTLRFYAFMMVTIMH